MLHPPGTCFPEEAMSASTTVRTSRSLLTERRGQDTMRIAPASGLVIHFGSRHFVPSSGSVSCKVSRSHIATIFDWKSLGYLVFVCRTNIVISALRGRILGCTTHSRRVAETRNHRLAGCRLTLCAGLAQRPAVADMARIRTEPSCCDRPQSDFRRARLD